jgi:hypothetical protein
MLSDFFPKKDLCTYRTGFFHFCPEDMKTRQKQNYRCQQRVSDRILVGANNASQRKYLWRGAKCQQRVSDWILVEGPRLPVGIIKIAREKDVSSFVGFLTNSSIMKIIFKFHAHTQSAVNASSNNGNGPKRDPRTPAEICVTLCPQKRERWETAFHWAIRFFMFSWEILFLSDTVRFGIPMSAALPNVPLHTFIDRILYFRHVIFKNKFILQYRNVEISPFYCNMQKHHKWL